MDIFGEAKKALQSLGSSVAQQAEYVKLQTRMGNLETDLERQYAEAGKRARTLWGMRKVTDKDLDVLMKRITNIEQEMEELREEIIRHGQESEESSFGDSG